MLVASTEDLHAGSDLSAVADNSPSQDAIATDVNARAHSSLRMGEERTELNSAGKRATSKRQMIEGNAKIVAQNARSQRKKGGETGEKRLPSTETRQRGGGEGDSQKHAMKNGLQRALEHVPSSYPH